uniref:BEN domain-containing protein n=1 Tax=Caenorhabditis japonica TaxID=281687 RepID=A0A8R1HIE6_CAEJA
MTTTTTVENIEPASPPGDTKKPEPPAKAAAVGFDTANQKLRVITADDISDSSEKGDTVDVDGRMLTILEFCDSIESARVSCEEHASGMNGMGLSSIKYEQGDDEEDDDIAQETSTSGNGDKDGEMDDIDEGSDDVVVGDEIDLSLLNHTGGIRNITELGAIANLQHQIDEMRNTMRDAVALSMTDLQHDIERVNAKQENLVRFYQKFLGTDVDGRVLQPFSDKFPTKLFDGPRGATYQPTGKSVEDIVVSQFDDMAKMWDVNQLKRQKLLKADILSSTTPQTTSKPKPKSSVKRPEQDNGDQEYTFGTNGTQGKRIVNGIVKAVDKLYYPFITREEEEECLEAAGGQAPIYAQLLAKILFSDTIMMYFKDQDTAKRNWLHDAVDYRFPTLDKPTHVSKWKNCSFFINKNMREAVIASGNPMPRAPCGPRGPIGPKDKSKLEKSEISSTDGDEEDTPVVVAPTPKSKGMRVNREASLEGIEWDYLDAEYEKECFAECRGDQYKYAELMALVLFKESLTIKFKEQDQTKKEWLRECVEARFPVEDRERNDQRWKICGQTCNRNRTKIVGVDGREEKYPYFDEAVEEECFQQAGGQPAVYAEMMNTKLFPDTQYLFFKDQDLGKRNWLHTILDKRFPSTDKIALTSKWKQCTNAINKKLFDGTVTPITKEAMLNGTLNGTVNDSSMQEQQPETPTSSVPRFERRLTSEAPSTSGGVKRRANDEQDTPAPKRESVRNKNKREKDIYTAYPYVSEETEVAIFEASNGNPQVYGRELGRVLFADTIKNYFKDQDADKRQWIHEILDFRYPSKSQLEGKQKWKNVTAAINRNMTSAVVSRRSLPH